MINTWVGRASCLVGLLAVAGCAADDGSEDSSNQNLSDGEASVYDHDFPIPNQSIPLQKNFRETLTRYGVTVTPDLTASGKLDLSDMDVHVQVEYTTLPLRVQRLDVSSRGKWAASARVDVDVKTDASWKASADVRKNFTAGTTLGGKAWEIGKVPIAAFPLPKAPNIVIHVDLELAAACAVDFDSDVHAYAEIGVGGEASADVFFDRNNPKKVGFVRNPGLSAADRFHVTTPPHVAFKTDNLAQLHGRCSIQASLNATASLGLEMPKPIADVGVKFVVEPYAEFDGKFNSTSDWSVDAKTGIAGVVSPFGDFFGHPFQQTEDFKLFDFELAKGPSKP